MGNGGPTSLIPLTHRPRLTSFPYIHHPRCPTIYSIPKTRSSTSHSLPCIPSPHFVFKKVPVIFGCFVITRDFLIPMAPTAITETVYTPKFAAFPHKTTIYPTRAMGKTTGVSTSATNSTPTNSNVVSDPTYPTLRTPTSRSTFSFDSMEDALAAFARGEFLVVMDDENRENEGDLIIAASQCTTEKMAWMIKHTR